MINEFLHISTSFFFFGPDNINGYQPTTMYDAEKFCAKPPRNELGRYRLKRPEEKIKKEMNGKRTTTPKRNGTQKYINHEKKKPLRKG